MKSIISSAVLLVLGFTVYSEAGFIGYVDRKIFYSDNVSRTWSSALTYCTSQNMELAEITSPLQQKLLADNYHPTNFNGRHWVNAQQNRLGVDTRWNKSDIQVIDYSTGLTFTAACLAYTAFASSSNGQWGMYGCTIDSFRTLCQAVIH